MSALLEPLTLVPRTPLDILSSAIAEHRPARVVALVSGGQDSTATLLAVRELVDGAAYIDTGTALPGVREHVEHVCSTLDVELDVLSTPWSEFEAMVLEHGFPGPAQHRIAYVRLKERRVDELVRQHKRHRHDRVLLVTGVREQESTRRMGTTQTVYRDGAQVWVAPIIEWDRAMVRAACSTAGIAPSEVSALMHRSGECNCGAFARPGERHELELWFPEWWQRVEDLERRAARLGVPATWGERPGKPVGGVGPLCSGCEQLELPDAADQPVTHETKGGRR